ncbi:MAG: lysostaphin resistance A-like protein [Terriglobales bacterium]
MPDLDYNTPPQEPEPPQREIIPSLDLRPQYDPPWTGWDVLLIALVALFSIVVFSIAAFAYLGRLALFQGRSVAELAMDPRIIVPVQTGAYVVVLAFMYWIVRSYGRRFWSAVHWKWPGRLFPCMFAGVVLAIGIQLSSALLPIPKQLPIERLFRTPLGAYLMGVFGITAAPLVEELFFRGFLYPVLARRLGIAPGVVVTSILFAFIHQSQLGHAWGPLLLLFIVGLVLTIVRARTDSVAPGFLIHVSYNFSLFLLLWSSTGHFRHFERLAQ